MEKMSFFEELKWRGLVKDIAGDDLEDKLNNEKILVTAKRFAKAGHNPILLVGGATGLIGDPRPTSEREIISKEAVLTNVESIKKQVKKIVGENTEVVNNNDWMKEFSFTDFLRDVGKYINVNYMLDKDIIRRRLETGITFAEFSYTLIQGYDFLHLFKEKNCILQAAGSDQWGNITTGVDLIRKMTGKQAYGFTMPLILDQNGKKFGKSEGNALWLDEDKTSSYELYQYLINADDSKVEEYLKVFTFLEPEEILAVMKEHNEAPHLRLAQKTLAREIITDLHGKESFEVALKISESLFSGDIKNLSVKEIEQAFNGIEPYNISESKNIVDLLVEASICSSKREAREFITNGSIYVNGERTTDLDMIIDKSIAKGSKYVIIRRGKKKYFVISF